MRRRRSFRRGSSRKVRKVYWNGFNFAGVGQVLRPSFGHGDVASFWAKWPSGTPDFGNDQIDNEGVQTPSDETLIKVLLNGQVRLPDQAALAPLLVTVGLITWEARTPADFEAVITEGQIPNPAIEWSADWIIRQPYSFTLEGFFEIATTAQFQESRAMRKLPPNTGILCCVALGTPLGAVEDAITVDWIIDGRLCLKSGYYSVGA